MKQTHSFRVGLLIFGVSIAFAGPVRADIFEFQFTFDDAAINTIADGNGGRLGTLRFDGPASVGTVSWGSLTNLAMSFTLGSDVYDLSDLGDPVGAIDMTIANVGGVLQITSIDDTAGSFAQFFVPGGFLAFPASPGRFQATSSQWSGSQFGTWVATVPAQITFEWAIVGNPGNEADPLNEGAIPGIGSVPYVYRIAKHEVTNDQYAQFLNSVAVTDTNGLYNESMGTDPRGGITQSGSSGSFAYNVKANMGNKPVNYVSFFDAMRFANWLHNNQPAGAQDAGTSEAGVYTISDGLSETRAGDVRFFLPTENEWYKAAYHDPGTAAEGGPPGDDNYWLYPTASDTLPSSATATATGDISNPGANVANHDFDADWNGQDGNATTVGSAGVQSESFYGTSDQGGNVWEWNETIKFGSFRGNRGGAWSSGNGFGLPSLGGVGHNPASEFIDTGFRVASPVFCGPADLDCDGDVDLADFELFMEQFEGPSGTPPVIALTSPSDGDTARETESINLSATASDNGFISRVVFTTSTGFQQTDSFAPYSVAFLVPGVESFTVQAEAIDNIGNNAFSETATVTVILAETSTVVGTVLGPDGLAFSGADVSVLGRAAVSQADGQFSIELVSTVSGDLIVRASASDNTGGLVGQSVPTPPVPGGTTDVGVIQLEASALEGGGR